MKHEKKLLRWMKELLSNNGLTAGNWRYIKIVPTDKEKPRRLIIIHKHSLKTKEVELIS